MTLSICAMGFFITNDFLYKDRWRESHPICKVGLANFEFTNHVLPTLKEVKQTEREKASHNFLHTFFPNSCSFAFC